MRKGLPPCAICGARLKEYVGLNLHKDGEGDRFCLTCEESDGVPVEVRMDVTPAMGTHVGDIHFQWDLDSSSTSWFRPDDDDDDDDDGEDVF
jgi:hypothetical protein